MYRVVREVPVHNGIAYLRVVQSIVPSGVLWGAIKHSGFLKYIELDGIMGFALDDGRVIALHGHSFNDILASAKWDKIQDCLLPEPRFATLDEPNSIRMGLFSEVYKNGYVVFPLEPYQDFENNPIVLMK